MQRRLRGEPVEGGGDEEGDARGVGAERGDLVPGEDEERE